MAFVPENGTGLPDANSLVDIPYADTYFADRADTEWLTFSQEKKAAYLILGTSYASTQYNYKGTKLNPNQALPFPRAGVIDPAGQVPQGVPTCVRNVVCELAKRASKGPLIQDPTIDEGGRAVKMKQQRVGPLHKTVEYAGPGEILEMSRYPAVDALMCPWLIQVDTKFANGVKLVGPRVEGTSNSRINAIAGSVDRYSGPINENNKDVVTSDGNSPF